MLNVTSGSAGITSVLFLHHAVIVACGHIYEFYIVGKLVVTVLISSALMSVAAAEALLTVIFCVV